MTLRRVMLFTRFERFWHWTQMVLIMLLLFTGFGIHGFHNLLDFKTPLPCTQVAHWDFCSCGSLLSSGT